jgi:predicted O-methyltransferase YrrM
MAGDEGVQIDIGKDGVLAHLLSPDPSRPRDEPEIATNIGIQLKHMGLNTWSISILRRLRDALGRLQPKSILEVGAGIGHRSAWIYDLFTLDERHPERYQLVEDGAKFAVILRRLMLRHDAEFGSPPLEKNHDAIIVDGTSENRARHVESMLPFLSPGGVLFTVEPDMPLGNVEESDLDGMKLVEGFNQWMEFIQNANETHHIAFMPLFGGTLVAVTKK